MTFTTYKNAAAYARQEAARLKIAQGIEYSKNGQRWVVRCLPRKENRYGCDARCEAVEP